MLRPDMKVDATRFIRAMREYRRKTGDSWVDIVRAQARGVAQRISSITPPRTKKQGEGAVSRDSNRAAASVQSGFLAWLRRESEARGEGIEAWRGRADGSRMKIEWPHVEEGGQGVRSFQEGRRDSRGRVRIPSSRGMAGDRWQELERVVTTKDTWEDELRKREAKVGLAKGAWSGVLAHLGGRVPAWLRRFSIAGGFRDLSTDRRNPRVVFWNSVRYARRQVGHRLQWVFSTRVRDMERDLKRRLGSEAGRFNRR